MLLIFFFFDTLNSTQLERLKFFIFNHMSQSLITVMSYWVLFYHSTVCHQLITHEIWLHSQEKKRLSNNHILGVPSYIPKFSFFHLTYICIIGVTWWRQWRQGQGHYEMTTMTMNGHHQLWWQPSVPPPTGMAMSPNMMTMKGSKMRGPRDVYDVSWVVFFIHMFSFKYFYSYDNDTKQSAPPIPTTTTTTTPPTRCHVISCKRLKGPRASTLLTALGPQVCFFLVMSILNQ